MLRAINFSDAECLVVPKKIEPSVRPSEKLTLEVKFDARRTFNCVGSVRPAERRLCKRTQKMATTDETGIVSRILLESHAGKNATRNAFFVPDRYPSPTSKEGDAVSVGDDAGDGLWDDVPLLRLFYSCKRDDEETAAGNYVFLSRKEIRRRKAAMNHHAFVDFCVSYIGMGLVHVHSVDSRGRMHCRVDGGSNGVERHFNAVRALEERTGPFSSVEEFLNKVELSIEKNG